MNSMTGYGLGESQNETYYFKVEIKSVNHRYCDLNLKMPRILFSKEDKIKRYLKETVSRGKVDVYINMTHLNSKDTALHVDLELAKKYYEASIKIKESLGLYDELSLGQILKMDGIVIPMEEEVNEEELETLLFEALSQARDHFMEMRAREGQHLKCDFEEKLSNIQKISERIAFRAPNVLKENEEKLRTKISQTVEENMLDLPRLTTEIALMFDKLSIDEEITRIDLHIKQFNDIMNSEETVGRKLDFLLQELNRETNTIGSKTTDMGILSDVVELKTEIEKLREQVQNIE